MNFYCINIPPSSLGELEKLWIYQYKFTDEKSISNIEITNNHNINNHKDLITILINTHNFSKPKQIPLHYITLAEELCEIILNTYICHKLTVIKLADEIHVSSKTLQRICTKIFKKNPQNIIHYLLTLKAIYLINANRVCPLSKVSNKLKFNDIATFTRYIKSHTGLSPTEIKKMYLNIRN